MPEWLFYGGVIAAGILLAVVSYSWGYSTGEVECSLRYQRVLRHAGVHPELFAQWSYNLRARPASPPAPSPDVDCHICDGHGVVAALAQDPAVKAWTLCECCTPRPKNPYYPEWMEKEPRGSQG